MSWNIHCLTSPALHPQEPPSPVRLGVRVCPLSDLHLTPIVPGEIDTPLIGCKHARFLVPARMEGYWQPAQGIGHVNWVQSSSRRGTVLCPLRGDPQRQRRISAYGIGKKITKKIGAQSKHPNARSSCGVGWRDYGARLVQCWTRGPLPSRKAREEHSSQTIVVSCRVGSQCRVADMRMDARLLGRLPSRR